jgi:hypothetical protein
MEKQRLQGLGRKVLIGALACTTAICFMLPQTVHAGVKSGYYTEQGLKAYQHGKYKLARKLFLKEPRYHEKCVAHMSAKRRKAYQAVIRKFKKNKKHPLSYNSYTDINKDGHAELLVKYGAYEADYRTNVYEYHSGKVHCVGKMWSGHMYYACYPNHNGVLAVYDGHMGGEFLEVYSLKHHKLYLRKKYPLHMLNSDASDQMEFPNELPEHNVTYMPF